jgi:hypothetical protein
LAYGLLGLSPEEFYSHTLIDFHERAYFAQDFHSRERDFQMQTVAWQTSLLMNASGNFKKKISHTDLYNSPYEETPEEASKTNRMTEEEKQNKLADLKAKFGK